MEAEAARERLLAEQERVRRLADSVRSDLGDEAENDEVAELSRSDQHPADSGSETFEREKELSILEQLEAELSEIEAALERVDAGTYGIDEETGEPIPDDRLEAIPTARTNVPTEDRD